MRKIAITFFILISSIVIHSNIAHACLCAELAQPDEALDQATAIFAGKVVDIVYADVSEPKGASIFKLGKRQTTFHVSKVWKGQDMNMIVITSNTSQCGYAFQKNKEYIVYAYGEENNLESSICSRTKLLKNAQKDLQVLDNSNQTLLIIGGITLLIIGGTLLIWKFHK